MPTDSLPTLYSFRRCPYAMRARMTLRHSNIRWLHREVDLKHKPAEMLAASSKGTVPVLITPSGQVIDESLDIMDWALNQHDPDQWQAKYAAAPIALRAVVATLETRFKPDLDAYKYNNRRDQQDWLPARNACEAFLIELEQLQDNLHCLNAEHPGYADIALLPFIRQCANVDPDWFASTSLAYLQSWLQALTGQPPFTAIMDKYEPWSPDQPPLVLPVKH